jgi:hypothetical protein
MKHMWTCRRTFICFTGIVTLGLLGAFRDVHVAKYIMGCVGFVAAANAWQKRAEIKANSVKMK